MVAHAAKDNSRGKKMKTIDKDTASVPDNPIEEGIGMMRLYKGSTRSHGETSVTVSEEQLSKKEIAGTSHEAGNSTDLKSDTSSPWWTGTVGMGGTTPPLQKQMKMKGREEEIGPKGRTDSSIGSTNATMISQGCTRVHYAQQRLDKMRMLTEGC